MTAATTSSKLVPWFIRLSEELSRVDDCNKSSPKDMDYVNGLTARICAVQEENLTYEEDLSGVLDALNLNDLKFLFLIKRNSLYPILISHLNLGESVEKPIEDKSLEEIIGDLSSEILSIVSLSELHKYQEVEVKELSPVWLAACSEKSFLHLKLDCVSTYTSARVASLRLRHLSEEVTQQSKEKEVDKRHLWEYEIGEFNRLSGEQLNKMAGSIIPNWWCRLISTKQMESLDFEKFTVGELNYMTLGGDLERDMKLVEVVDKKTPKLPSPQDSVDSERKLKQNSWEILTIKMLRTFSAEQWDMLSDCELSYLHTYAIVTDGLYSTFLMNLTDRASLKSIFHEIDKSRIDRNVLDKNPTIWEFLSPKDAARVFSNKKRVGL